jgi:hypothetical protein
MSASEHLNRHLLGALSNYVSLGEIPDFNESGTQGYDQHQALLDEIKQKGKLNEKPLYRGAILHPHEEKQNTNRPRFISLTEDPDVAELFAHRKVENKGRVHEFPPGSVRTISVNSYQFDVPDQAETYGFKQYPWEEEHLANLDDF